ncbi:MAG: ATP-binding cassette domain-containing protein, partial [Verrucomicrobiota bacterium]
MNNHETEIVVRGLTKKYKGDIKALAGVDLSVMPLLYSLLGPNGASKSTLMHTLASLQLPDSGSISLDRVKHGLSEIQPELPEAQGIERYRWNRQFSLT